MSRTLFGLGLLALGYYLYKQSKEIPKTEVANKVIEDAKVSIAGVYQDPWNNYSVFSSFKKRFNDSEADTVAPAINARIKY